jgi:hypothetical protein
MSAAELAWASVWALVWPKEWELATASEWVGLKEWDWSSGSGSQMA